MEFNEAIQGVFEIATNEKEAGDDDLSACEPSNGWRTKR